MHIKVKVKTGARRERLVEIVPGTFEADVKEKAERNAANEGAIALVANHFGVPKKSVRIVSGHRRPNKTLRVIK